MNESDESAGARRSEELRPLDCAPASSIESSPGAGDSDRLAAILVSIGLVVSALFITAEGLLHFDDLTHYLFAKWAWTYPAYLLDEWGRPGFTALYFLPAKMGWVWCKLLSAILTAWSAWFAYRIAQTLKLPHAWAAVPLAYGQPLFFQLAQTTLTETVLAFYLTLAVFLALRHRWSWSAAALSLAFVTRHEAIVFLPLWFYVARREGVALKALWPILWAPLIVNTLGPIAGHQPLYQKFLDPSPSTQYGSGSWFTFFARSMEAWGPGITVLGFAGLGRCCRARRGVLVAGSIVVYFSAQTIIRALGLFDSGGYARFLVGISPLVAVSAVAGWSQLWQRDESRRRIALLLTAGVMLLLWASTERHIIVAQRTRELITEFPELSVARLALRVATAMLCLLAVVSWWLGRRPDRRALARSVVPTAVVLLILPVAYRLCRPLGDPPEARVIEQALQALDEKGLGDREIISAVVWMDYAKGHTLSPRRPNVRQRLAEAEIGTLFAWERQFAASQDHGLPGREFASSPSWLHVLASAETRRGAGPYLIFYEKIAPWSGEP